MFATERDREETELEAYIPEHVLDAMSLQDLYGEETHPNGASEGRFDAALGEILHLITSAGYADGVSHCLRRESKYSRWQGDGHR